jgi:beta-lactamase class A
MYKYLKLFTLTALIAFVCTCDTYSAEPVPAPAAIPSPSPAAIETAPPPASAPVPPVEEPPAEEQPLEEQPSEDQPSKEEQAANELAAAEFAKELDAIIIKRVDSFIKKSGKGTIGIYIKELGSGLEYAYNGDKTNPDNPSEGYFNTASTCKLLSAAVMYYLNHNGELELNKVYTDSITKSSYNLSKILPRMISHSVNDYFNITLRHLGAEKINKTLLELGVKDSIVYSEIMPAQYSSVKNNIARYGISRSPRTTPRDLGHVLWLLHEGKTFGEENDKIFVKSLLDNIYSNRLPAGIGYKSPVAHKTGTSSGEGVYNDAGIVYLEGNPYIIVVMSKDCSSNVQALFRSIAGDVYGYMKKRTDAQSLIPQ